jgi:hypothetical protein
MTPAIARWLFEKADAEYKAAEDRLSETKQLLALHEHTGGNPPDVMADACAVAVATHKDQRRQVALLKSVVADLLDEL